MPVSLTSTRTNPSSAPSCHRDAALHQRVLVGVGDEVRENLRHPVCIGPHSRQRITKIELEPLPLGFDQWAQRAGHLRDQTGEVQARAMQIDPARLYAREIKEIVDQPQHPVRILP